MTDIAWYVKSGALASGAGDLSGIRVELLSGEHWAIDYRGPKIRAYGPFSTQAAARAAIEQKVMMR